MVGQPVQEADDPLQLVGVVDRPDERVLVVGQADRVALACSERAATKSSWMRGPASTRVAAVQSWPALK